MHRLLSVNEAVATRNLELKNLKTATTDWCFDDSALTSFENFDFMEIGEEYNCSIYLFGICSEDGEYFNYIKNVKIGNRELCEISNENQDIYYIDQNNIKNIKDGQAIKYAYTRKDLIQVAGVVHPNFTQI